MQARDLAKSVQGPASAVEYDGVLQRAMGKTGVNDQSFPSTVS